MNQPRPNCTPRACNTRSITSKPLTKAELTARKSGEYYLSLAHAYRNRGDTLNATSCCIEALESTAGVARPLAVRDQVFDLLRAIDPGDLVSGRMRACMRQSSTNGAYWSPALQHKHLERLVSVHQLVPYPSGDIRFNQAYEKATWCLRKTQYDVRELYIVTYTSGLISSSLDRYFAAVPHTMISGCGPYYLTDICAVVRR